MPKRRPPTPRTGHVYERTERSQGDYLHACMGCSRRVTNRSGLPPQQFRKGPLDLVPQLVSCPGGEEMTAEDYAGAFEMAGAAPAKPKRRKRAKKTGASK